LCDLCQRRRPPFVQARAWGIHEENSRLREAIHNLKYRRDVGLGEVLAREMIAVLFRQDWKLDVVLPVPLAPNRHKQRGYNQSALLAWPIALRLGLPYRPGFVWRVRETQSQVGLSRPERYQNVAGAFKASDETKGKSVLVVDDVTTTGATLEAVVEALLVVGAKEVYTLTLARAA
jgi:ComF family protein